MPQMEFGDYLPQLVWLVITFAALYLLMSRVALPRIAEVLEGRAERIADDIERADQYRSEAEQTLKEYEILLGKAREEGHTVSVEARIKQQEQAKSQSEASENRLKEKMVEAEVRIQATRSEAMAGLKDIATEITRVSVQRLIGITPDERTIKVAVEEAAGKLKDV
tara:strand:+ start:1197 stop:1694 length:498 start_codon:yes stop_codon:yes gene_type:complete